MTRPVARPVTFWCPPGTDVAAQEAAARREVGAGRRVVFHAHAMRAPCLPSPSCWEES